MVNYPLYWPVTFMKLQNILNPLSNVFLREKWHYVALQHFSPLFTLYFHSFALQSSAFALHGIWVYVQCHRLPSTLAHAICRCVWECCYNQFSGKAGWRTEGNINLHTREPLKLINAYCDQTKTSNIHYRPWPTHMVWRASNFLFR